MKLYLLLITFFLSIGLSNAQQNKGVITGKIQTAEGFTAPQVMVGIKGILPGVFSNADGSFKISAVAGKVRLVIKSETLGRLEVEVTVAAGKETNAGTLKFDKNCTDLNEVVITATRTEKNLMVVPVPVTRISSEEIKNRGLVRLNEILAEQTGLAIVDDHGQGIQMQGFDPQYTMIMIDGEPVIGRTSGTLELSRITLLDIDKIEIVKGPVSSLYGSDAMAGVINIISKMPKEGLAGAVTSRFGTNNNADLSLQGSYKKDKFNLSGFINRNSSSGYSLKPESGMATVSPFSGYTGNVRMDYKINEKSRLDISARYYDNIQKNNYILGDRTVSGDGKEENFSINPTFTTQFSDKVKSALRLYYSRYKTNSNLVYNDDRSEYDVSYFDQNFSRAEFQTDYSVRNHLKLTGGVGGQYETVEATRYDEKRKFSSGYGYFQADYTPLEKLNIIAGGRYDMHSVYRSQFSPKLALSYRLTDDLTFLASAGKGYKAPDFRQLYLNFTNAVVGYSVFGYEDAAEKIRQLQAAGQIQQILVDPATLQKLNAESSTSYNAGFRYQVLSNFRLSANVFRNNIKNLISTVAIAIKTNGQSAFSYLNLNRVNTQGAEFDMNYSPVQNVQLSGGFQYLDAFNQEDVDRIKAKKVYRRDPVSGETTLVKLSDYGGLLNRSKYMANAAIGYNNDKKGIFASFRAIYRCRYGIRDLDGNNIVNMDSEYVKGYTLFNASVSKLLFKNNLRLQATAENLFNYKNTEYISNLSGRLWYGSITYNFK